MLTTCILLYKWLKYSGFSLTAGFIAAYPKGGPVTLCYDPYPHHAGSSRSLDPSPFSISLSATEYNPGDIIKGVCVCVLTPYYHAMVISHNVMLCNKC